MAMRNWWIHADVDGRKSDLCGGPRSKDGGFSLTVRQRDKGSSKVVLTLSGWVDLGGKLVLDVRPAPARETLSGRVSGFSIVTER